MVKKIGKQNKAGLAVSLEKMIVSFGRGLRGLLGLAAKLEKEGKDEYTESGEIAGETRSGKKYKGAYGFRVKVGLDPDENKLLWR